MPVAAPLSAAERTLMAAVAERRDALVALASALVALDTTAAGHAAPARQEAQLQALLAGRLAAAGAAHVDVWEPDPADVAGSRQVPDGLRFDGRPQLVARFAGGGAGRSLLFCGHVDVVPPGDEAAWTTPPLEPVVRDGRLFGRGSCDMKGGIAAMVLAAEVLAAEGPRLAGDLLVSTVTDEEETGAGAIAAVARGLRADAALLPEPSSFATWVACRGDLVARIVVDGRMGHAGLEHPDPAAGDAVNAIERAQPVMAALRALHERWQHDPRHRHRHLSPGHVVPTMVRAGDWPVNVPDRCELTYHIAYLPAHADAAGWGTLVAAEVQAAVAGAAAADAWLAAHPPRVRWLFDIPAAEVDEAAPIVDVALAVTAAVGREARRAGLDSWHDGATLTRFAGTPAVALGPVGIEVAHTVDEHVAIDDLLACAQAYALAAVRFCGGV